MNGVRTFTHLISVALLLLWGGVMLYFYASGRIIHYLPPDGIFQPMVLIAGIGLVVLGLFNLLTLRNAEHDCCHDHGHGHGHDDDDGHDHSHAKTGCCGHEHGHAHEHESHGAKGTQACCGHHHEHAHEHHHHHEEPAHSHTCCDHHHEHDHSHDHSHEHHHHDHTHEDHTHAHGMLEESSLTGRLVAIAILAIPLTLAALNTPDQFSPAAIANKGLYNPNYSDTSRADQFSLKKADALAPGLPTPQPTAADLAAVTTADTPPAPQDSPAATSPAGSDAPPATTAGAGGSDTESTPQSYGSFTLADLEAQVPKSEAGNFILDVPEIYYTGGDIEVQNVLKGQSIETIAQILPEKVNNDDGHRLRIFRMMVQCCAADARPYSIPVDFGKAAPEFKEMAWVKVTGTMSYKDEGGQTVPILEVKTIEETTAPDQSMIY